MSVIDKFLDAIKLNDDYDDEDEFLDDDFDEEDDYEEKKVSGRFFKRIDDSDDADDYDDLDEPAPKKTKVKEAPKPKKAESPKPQPKKERSVKKPARQQPKRRSANAMEVSVIKPTSMEDGRDICDTLLDDCTVVLNLEGLDVDLAQRIIDFTCGACYSIGGSIQMISSYIFILTPSSVDITGDYQSILDDAFDIPAMKSQY